LYVIQAVSNCHAGRARSTLYNYADDNTLSYVDNYEQLIDILEKESSIVIDWYPFLYISPTAEISLKFD
jgi:hypothetical protein